VERGRRVHRRPATVSPGGAGADQLGAEEQLFRAWIQRKQDGELLPVVGAIELPAIHGIRLQDNTRLALFPQPEPGVALNVPGTEEAAQLDLLPLKSMGMLLWMALKVPVAFAERSRRIAHEPDCTTSLSSTAVSGEVSEPLAQPSGRSPVLRASNPRICAMLCRS